MFSLTAYIRETIEEIKKVSWPSQQQTIEMTILVIAVSIIVGAYIGAADYLFQFLLGFIL